MISGATDTSFAFVQSLAVGAAQGPEDLMPELRVEHVMGMPVVVDVRDDDVDADALDEAFAWLHWVDATFSTYKEDSEISRLNRGELALEDAHPEVRAVLARCEELRAETGGYFDAQAASPGALDPSGLVKGWSVDRAAEILEAAGVAQLRPQRRRRHAAARAREARLVLAGRDPAPAAARPGRRRWSRPRELAVATSGEYARGQHVLDPHTGRPPEGDPLGDGRPAPSSRPQTRTRPPPSRWATPRALHWTARLRGFEAMTILADGRVLTTPGFPD